MTNVRRDSGKGKGETNEQKVQLCRVVVEKDERERDR